ncbi:unnamed protein product [Brassica rapa]|uniref:Uncharacterized protein n=1 Tax=Brassica campestris TaxID=3711 RepID=A0A8D9FYX4_BRACM|nr:unnamed protein product [Brassica rapa]
MPIYMFLEKSWPLMMSWSNHCLRFYHVGCRLRPSDDMMANNYLKNKVLGQPMKALIIPEECDHIISISPRDLPVGEDITVFDPQGNDVGVKRTYALIEHDEESDDISLPDEIESPREEWFIEEISLPPSVADTDLVFCQEWFIEEISLSPSVVDIDLVSAMLFSTRLRKKR